MCLCEIHLDLLQELVHHSLAHACNLRVWIAQDLEEPAQVLWQMDCRQKQGGSRVEEGWKKGGRRVEEGWKKGKGEWCACACVHAGTPMIVMQHGDVPSMSMSGTESSTSIQETRNYRSSGNVSKHRRRVTTKQQLKTGDSIKQSLLPACMLM